MSRTYRRKKDSGTMHDWSYRLSVYKILGKTESEVTKLKSVFTQTPTAVLSRNQGRVGSGTCTPKDQHVGITEKNLGNLC